MGKKFDDSKRKGQKAESDSASELEYDPEVASDRDSDVSLDSEEEAMQKKIEDKKSRKTG